MESEKSTKDMKKQSLSNDNPQSSQSSHEELNSADCELLPGDILWARIGRQPFWPCVVIVNPQNSMYLETKRIGRSSLQLVHVQYFGDNGSRSWVSVKQIIKFTGKNNLLKFAETKKKDKKYSTAFPLPNKNQKWDLAVQEAEEAAQKSSNERIQFFEEYYPIFIQEKNDNEKRQTKEKVNQSVSQKSHLERKINKQNGESPDKESNNSAPTDDVPRKVKVQNGESPDKESNNSAPTDDVPQKIQKRVREKDNSDENLKSEKKKPRKVIRRKKIKKPPGVFDIFVDRCAHLFAIHTPEFKTDRAKCIRYMQAMWSTMTEDEKSRYHETIDYES